MAVNRKSVYLDTTILKFAVDKQHRLTESPKTLNWGGRLVHRERQGGKGFGCIPKG